MNVSETTAKVDEQAPSPERILKLLFAYWGSALVSAAATHRLFTHIEQGAQTLDEITQRAAISRRGAQALLDGLAGLGLIRFSEGRYTNAEDAAVFLVEGKPFCVTGLARSNAALMALWSQLAEAVKTGSPVGDVYAVAEHPFWEELAPGLMTLGYPVASVVSEHLKAKDAGPLSILDVGGGSGIYSFVLLMANPQAKATQMDWKNVNVIARRLAQQFGVANRFDTIDVNFLKADFGTGYQIGIYANIAHQASPEENIMMFRKFRQALDPNGTLVISDFILDDNREGNPMATAFSANMLVTTEAGASWREADYREWLNQAQFTDISLVPTPTPSTLIFAR